MKQFKLWNNVVGWAAFVISLIVYTLTLEPSASFWDCGEFLSTSDKLQVPHPPGAPMFLLIAKVFSFLALGNQANVAFWINMLSATTSALTVLFMFWTITHLAKKIVIGKETEISQAQVLSILGAGLVGSMTVTFIDTFWFSAVEAEVYAASCFFTAITFWCILKWENIADEPYADRWLVLICYIVGLAIGVHLLNILVIPAVVFVYYFKRYETTTSSFIYALIAAMASIIIVQYVIIPGYPWVAAKSEIFLVNKLGMPFNSGFFFLIALIVTGIIFSLRWTKRRGKPLLHTITLGIAFITIGYSSYAMVIIRSIANVPLDHQNVEDPNAFLSYLNREQYGERPLVKGQTFRAHPIRYVDGDMQYRRDEKTGKYIPTTKKYDIEWSPEDITFFPRMWSNRGDHVQAYESWEQLRKDEKPKFKHHLDFLFSYQLGFMYWRYFLWNFVGRQNDEQGNGELTKGKVLSGINAIDKMWLGPQDNLPENMASNKGRNTYYFLPLILGLLGLFFHVRRNQKDAFVILLLFLFTGIFIILYLNFPPLQPRERDYAYVGSYQYFCVWVGLGVLAIIEWLRKKVNPTTAAVVATAVCFVAVPALIGSQNWDDHNRSNRYTCRDFAWDYLQSCDSNAVLFTNGDNDTYPLWYAQNVEGIRSDVRVINLSLLNTDWYVDVMKRKALESEPIEFPMKPEQYSQGTRDYLPTVKQAGLGALGVTDSEFVDLKKVMDFVEREDGSNKAMFGNSPKPDFYMPTSKFSIKVDKEEIKKYNVVAPEDMDKVVDEIKWDIGERTVYKNDMVILDLIANNHWKRPIYFTITTGDDAYINMYNYFRMDGLCYRFVPIFTQSDENRGKEIGYINSERLYNTVMKKWRYGNMGGDGVYLDQATIIRQARNFRNIFCRLAQALVDEKKFDKAIEVLDRCQKELPEKNIPIDIGSIRIAQTYFMAGAKDKAKAILDRLIARSNENLKYFAQFTGSKAGKIQDDIRFEEYMKQKSEEVKKNFEGYDINKMK